MYYYELATAKLSPIGTPDMACENPVFSRDGTSLIYFQRKADGPHQAAMEMVQVRV